MYEMNDDVSCNATLAPIKDSVLAQAYHWHSLGVGGSPSLGGKSFITSDNDNKWFLPHTVPFITALIP